VRAGIAAAALAVGLALIPVYGSDEIYDETTNLEHIDKWSATQQYVSRGLLYPFLYSVKSALPNPPEGYDPRQAAAVLAEYGDGEIPEDKKVNIVGIMLEAFADFSVYDQIEFQWDMYATYHALEAESYTGNLVTNIFAGGTVDTERAFLTGMSPRDVNYRSNTPSYVWYLKSQGYWTFGGHPNSSWFYNRANINSYLGFEQYSFNENYYGPEYLTTPTTDDSIFLPDLARRVLMEVGHGAPLFSFSVSYQGHGPYSSEACWWGGVDDYIANYNLDGASRCILANYLGSVLSTQAYLAQVVDAFRASDEPIVLVVFGDHKPWLGNGGSVYNELGIEFFDGSVESFYNYWSTRYLIWANDAAKETIGHDLVGEGPDISPCFLMNVLFEQLGWQGDAYMQAVEACRREVPVVQTGEWALYVTADGSLNVFEWLTQEQADLVRQFRCLQYYRQRHFSY
ncbi:MAG: LTA synthase family protein, partial [Oscillospiraceae bacterium]|nr:LTA synthase family protein [Oscillospiraceae bacterium]